MIRETRERSAEFAARSSPHYSRASSFFAMQPPGLGWTASLLGVRGQPATWSTSTGTACRRKN